MPIGLSDLLTPNGLRQLRLQVATLRVNTVRTFLKKLDPHGEDTEDQRQLYEDCLPYIRDDQLDRDDLSLRAGGIALERGGCAPHVQQAIDALGGLKVELGLAAIETGLTDYGRCVLAAVVAPAVACSLPRAVGLHAGVYMGVLGGKTPITLVIENIELDGSIDGRYYYDKYASSLRLRGKSLKQGNAKLVEQDDESAKISAEFDLTAETAGALSGEWRSAAVGGKVLPVKLQPLRQP